MALTFSAPAGPDFTGATAATGVTGVKITTVDGMLETGAIDILVSDFPASQDA